LKNQNASPETGLKLGMRAAAGGCQIVHQGCKHFFVHAFFGPHFYVCIYLRDFMFLPAGTPGTKKEI
jgi:hypothetical protein